VCWRVLDPRDRCRSRTTRIPRRHGQSLSIGRTGTHQAATVALGARGLTDPHHAEPRPSRHGMSPVCRFTNGHGMRLQPGSKTVGRSLRRTQTEESVDRQRLAHHCPRPDAWLRAHVARNSRPFSVRAYCRGQQRYAICQLAVAPRRVLACTRSARPLRSRPTRIPRRHGQSLSIGRTGTHQAATVALGARGLTDPHHAEPRPSRHGMSPVCRFTNGHGLVDVCARHRRLRLPRAGSEAARETAQGLPRTAGEGFEPATFVL
jgi:hypothetical protein